MQKQLMHYAFFLFTLFSSQSFAQVTDIFDTPGAGTFTVPCGVTSITIAVYGGGGGGGGSNSNSIGGGGGGAGGYAEATFAVVPGQVIPFTVGAGGAGGGPAGNGQSGGQTNLNPFSALTAFGGTGGLCENNGGTGGTGGTGSGFAINVTGGNGIDGTNIQGGAGGAAGGPNGGGGGAGGGPGVVGGIGSNYGGGGGGGGRKQGGNNPSGGAAAGGAVIFTYTPPYNIPNAGADVSTCNVVNLQGNTPTPPWVGTWVIISGAPVIADVNDPNSVITIPVPGTCAVVEWQFTQAGCPTMGDQVQICYPALCNDDPCGGIALTINSGTCSYTTYSNNNATASTGMVEPGCGDWSDNDAWYTVTVPASGVVSINATDQPGGPGMIMGMSLYSEGSGGCNDLFHEGCDFATSSGDAAEMTYAGVPGETVYIRVWDYFENEGSYQLCAFEPNVSTGDITAGFTTVTCGAGALSFIDPGGTSGNYESNTTAIYELCPDTPGQYVTADFTTGALFFDLENGADFLTVLDGAADSSFIIGQYTGTNNPGIITSSAPDGCLTFIFSSDNTIEDLGWEATIDCSAIAGVNDSTCTATDCPGECGTWICATGLYPTENIGNVNEDMVSGTMGCFDDNGEVSSQWFYFTILTSGAIEFSFAGPGGQDYNFAVYGPSTNGYPPCPQTTGEGPIICSQADVGNYSINGLTGLSATLSSGDMYEGPEGDGWVDALQGTAGETYAMLVNIYQNGGPQPVIDLTIGGNGQLDCSPVFLPVELLSFTGINQGVNNKLMWTTASEINNDYFTVERSVNGYDWVVVGTLDGAGTTTHGRYYELLDTEPYLPITYYRLKQTDTDGQFKNSEVISVSNNKLMEGDIASPIFPNPATTHATFTFAGENANLPLQVRLIDRLGAVVMQEEFNNLYEGMPLTLRIEDIAQGLYQVVFIQGENLETKKLSIIR